MLVSGSSQRTWGVGWCAGVWAAGRTLSWGKTADPSARHLYCFTARVHACRSRSSRCSTPAAQTKSKNRETLEVLVVRTGAGHERDLALQRSRCQAEGTRDLVILAGPSGDGGSDAGHSGSCGDVVDGSRKFVGRSRAGRSRRLVSARGLLGFGLLGLWRGAGWNEVRHEAAEDVCESHSMGFAGQILMIFKRQEGQSGELLLCGSHHAMAGDDGRPRLIQSSRRSESRRPARAFHFFAKQIRPLPSPKSVTPTPAFLQRRPRAGSEMLAKHLGPLPACCCLEN